MVPGGVAHDVDSSLIGNLLERLSNAERDVVGATNLLWNTPSVMNRFEDTGILTHEACLDLGIVGLAARASGVKRDIRSDFPSDLYRFMNIPTAHWETGDVFGRAFVRSLEMNRSIEFIRSILSSLPEGSSRENCSPSKGNLFGVTLVEGWRGEICHIALTNTQGQFSHYKAIDPSFRNWTGLALALRGGQISDFPLCNKSFNLSYCGHDL